VVSPNASSVQVLTLPTSFERVLIGHTLGAKELSRNIDSFTTNDDNLLSTEKLLGDDAGKTSEQMTFAINDDLSLRKVCVSPCRQSDRPDG